jgi:predicted esterase YcpF (UPF0227 family)
MKNKINVLYVHGYMGSGSGDTAITIKRLLNADRYNYISPQFSNRVGDIEQNIQQINDIIEKDKPGVVIGNSLGTFEVMNTKSGMYRILINPVFNPVSDSLQPEIFDESFAAISHRISELANSFNFDDETKLMTYGFFGADDDVVSCQSQFKDAFGADNITVFPGVGHRLFEPQLKVVVERIDWMYDRLNG